MTTTPDTRSITPGLAIAAYTAFACSMMGLITAAAYMLPADHASAMTKMVLAVWPLLFMADQATSRHFSTSFVGMYLLPGVRSGLIFVGWVALMNSLGFETYPDSRASALELATSLAGIAFLGATSSALVRLIIWSGFEMIPSRLQLDRT